MLMKPLLGTKPWGQSGTQVVSAFMKLTSALREADSAEKRVRCPDGGGVNTTKQVKGRMPGPGEALRRGQGGPGGR